MCAIETLYDTIGEFRNRRVACEILQSRVPEFADKTPEEVADILEADFDKDKILYFGTNYRPCDNNPLLAQFLWIPSGYNNTSGNPLYIQFVKTAYVWAGAFVGTPTEISKHQAEIETRAKTKKEMTSNIAQWEGQRKAAENRKKETVPKPPKSVIIPPVPVVSDGTTKPKVSVLSNRTTTATDIDENDSDDILPEEKAFYDNFYAKLLVKTGWNPSLIKTYLRTMVMRENHLLYTKRGENFIIRSSTNNNVKYVMMNTALLNTLGYPIKLIVKFWGTNPETPLGYDQRHWVMCDSKGTALQYGFTLSDMNKELLPVTYYEKDASELIFSAEIDEFDLENEQRLAHCIDRKAERDTSALANMPDNQIYTSIIQAINTGVAISKYDNNYIKPFYNRRHNRIHFVIPYHTDGVFESTPKLGIVIAKDHHGLWQVMTVLDYKQVVSNCNCLAPYRASSF